VGRKSPSSRFSGIFNGVNGLLHIKCSDGGGGGGGGYNG